MSKVHMAKNLTGNSPDPDAIFHGTRKVVTAAINQGFGVQQLALPVRSCGITLPGRAWQGLLLRTVLVVPCTSKRHPGGDIFIFLWDYCNDFRHPCDKEAVQYGIRETSQAKLQQITLLVDVDDQAAR